MTAPDPLAATWRLVTEPLRPPVNDWEVTDAEAAIAQRRLEALDDVVFDAIVLRMATIEGGKFLRRLITETEEEAEAPEAVRAFVARVAEKASTRSARACLEVLRGHALGRFIDALGKAEKPLAQKVIRAAGGPDVVAAGAIEDGLRARAAEDGRALGSISRALGALLRTSPPAVETLRLFARAFAARPRSWPSGWAATVAAALERSARDTEAEGNVYDRPPELPPPFDEDFGAKLVDALRANRPRGRG